MAVGAGPGPAGHHEDQLVAARGHPVGRRRGRRVAGVCLHAARAYGGILRDGQLGRAGALEGRAGALLCAGAQNAGRGTRAPTIRRRQGARTTGTRAGQGTGLPAYRGGHLLWRGRAHHGRSVFRRRGAGAHGLHLVWCLHDGLPGGGQEQPRQELPLPRHEARRQNPGRAQGGGRAPRGRSRRKRWLRRHRQAQPEMVGRPQAHLSRAGRRLCGWRDGHGAAADEAARALAAPPVGAGGQPHPHQQRDAHQRHHADAAVRFFERGGHRFHPAHRCPQPPRGGALRRRLGLLAAVARAACCRPQPVGALVAHAARAGARPHRLAAPLHRRRLGPPHRGAALHADARQHPALSQNAVRRRKYRRAHGQPAQR